MVTGALAASYYGLPRTTADIDLIVRIPRRELPNLLSTITKLGLQVNQKQVNAALKAGYNVLTFKDKKSSNTLDIILTRGKLTRKRGSNLGIPTYYQTPEALILAKLRMIKATIGPEKSQKDKQDIRGIIEYTEVDLDAVKQKARREATLDLLLRILR